MVAQAILVIRGPLFPRSFYSVVVQAIRVIRTIRLIRGPFTPWACFAPPAGLAGWGKGLQERGLAGT